MSMLTFSPDELLATTRAVRKRLDLTRPVSRELIEECLRLAQQAPTGSNRQDWHFVVVTDPAKREALAGCYRRGWNAYRAQQAGPPPTGHPARLARMGKVLDSAQYLADHLHEVPVHVVPCVLGRTEDASIVAQASRWGSVLPAVWSFMLAARARGLGTCWTTLHLVDEAEAAAALGIPYAEVMQAALIPVAHTIGEDFKPATRAPLDTMVHWEER
jgi:nitroreductase